MSHVPRKIAKRVPFLLLHPRPYSCHSQPYPSNQVSKVMDATGVVHETCVDTLYRGYRRRTRCVSTRWYLVEPLNIVSDSVVTTCLECVGASDASAVLRGE